jgi:hypothetical protein
VAPSDSSLIRDHCPYRGFVSRKTEFNRKSSLKSCERSRWWWSDVRIDRVFLHERVTDTQSAKYGGDDDGHAAHDDRYRCFHPPKGRKKSHTR